MAQRVLDLRFDLETFRVENFTRDDLEEMCYSRSLSCTRREKKAKLGERLREWHHQTFNADGTLKNSAGGAGNGWPDLAEDEVPPAFVLPVSAWGLQGVNNGRTQDLVPTLARDVPLNSVVFYQHAGSGYFHLYLVDRKEPRGPFVRLISAIPGVAAPCPSTLISLFNYSLIIKSKFKS